MNRSIFRTSRLEQIVNKYLNRQTSDPSSAWVQLVYASHFRGVRTTSTGIFGRTITKSSTVDPSDRGREAFNQTSTLRQLCRQKPLAYFTENRRPFRRVSDTAESQLKYTRSQTQRLQRSMRLNCFLLIVQRAHWSYMYSSGCGRKNNFFPKVYALSVF